MRLYRGTANRGVAVVLTDDAYAARLLALEYFDEHGTYDGIAPEIEDTVRRGTMTFVRPTVYAAQAARAWHYGTYAVLDRLAAMPEHEVITVDTSIFVPFSNGPRFAEEELALGYGPRAVILCALLGVNEPVEGTVLLPTEL